MLRRLLIAVLVLLVAAVVVVDRVGAHVAAHVLAGKLQTDEHLPNRPSVSIAGVPFLTQAIGGKYHDVSITAHGFKTPDGVTVTTLKATLHGAHIPLSKVLGGSVSKVPVDRVTGTAYVSFADITRYLGANGTSVTLRRTSPTSIEVARKVPLGKRTAIATGIAKVTVNNDLIVLSVGDIDSTSIVGVKRQPSHVVLVQPFSLAVPLRSLPFRIDVKSVTVGTSGITATGAADHVTLGS
ncbi:MAG TPA: DUF2993 domain-containing protein [Mycobacteriales bacterium]|jgi:hypothetical protein|nr:DUF2993 domain-containing protein [Mycobacteriales bacterium]